MVELTDSDIILAYCGTLLIMAVKSRQNSTGQGTLIEGQGSVSTLDLHIKVTCFVKR